MRATYDGSLPADSTRALSGLAVISSALHDHLDVFLSHYDGQRRGMRGIQRMMEWVREEFQRRDAHVREIEHLNEYVRTMYRKQTALWKRLLRSRSSITRAGSELQTLRSQDASRSAVFVRRLGISLWVQTYQELKDSAPLRRTPA